MFPQFGGSCPKDPIKCWPLLEKKSTGKKSSSPPRGWLQRLPACTSPGRSQLGFSCSSDSPVKCLTVFGNLFILDADHSSWQLRPAGETDCPTLLPQSFGQVGGAGGL